MRNQAEVLHFSIINTRPLFCKRGLYPYFSDAQSSIEAKRSLALNKSEMHQIPARATTVYIILLTRASCPPHIHATISNWKSPMLPQLSAPIIVNIRAILSMIIVKSSFKTVFPSAFSLVGFFIFIIDIFWKYSFRGRVLLNLLSHFSSFSIEMPLKASA